MKKTIIASTLLLTSSLLQAAEAPATPQGPVLTINDIDISMQALLTYRDSRQGLPLPNDPQQAQNQIISELVTTVLLSEEAKKMGLADRPGVKEAIDMYRRIALRDVALIELMNKQTVSEEELKTAYDKAFMENKSIEYKARHILVDDEAKAKELIGKLDGGADFAELAKENSTGPTGKSGGDLGWFSPEMMVEPFRDAIAAMEKGKYSKEPVKTQFGWHVILLEESRDQEPPALATVKPQLEQQLKSEKLRALLTEMSKDVKVSSPQMAAPAEAVPAPAEPETTPAK
ncbi:MAG: peptidylprolyl isomerase [Pseudomonadota bacterium]